MKKYNLSTIMKRAWELVKKVGMTISSGLKKAWKEAKVVKMTVEKLVERYGIKQESILKSGVGFTYTDRIAVHYVSLAQKENMISEIKERKQEILDYLYGEREKEKRAYQERQNKIDAIEGLKEIESAMIDLGKWHEEFEKSFDDVGGLGVRPKPEYDFEAMYKKYPVAKAYLTAKEYSEKSNYELAAMGRRALEKIIDNQEEYEKAIEEMRTELREFTSKHLWD